MSALISIEDFLKNLAKEHGIDICIVSDKIGLPKGSCYAENIDAGKMAALIASITELSTKAFEFMEIGEFKYFKIKGDDKKIYVISGDTYKLLMLIKNDSEFKIDELLANLNELNEALEDSD